MNKRGQIYILAALILALVLYLLLTKTNIIYEHEIIDDFETLSRNYDIEASKFMNKLLIDIEKYIGEDSVEKIGDEFDEFTVDFTKYSINQNPDFGLIYLFDFNENLYIGNYLKHPLIVGEDTPILLEGCIDKITGIASIQGFSFSAEYSGEGCKVILPSTDKLSITIGNSLYVIEITKNRPDIAIVSREEKDEQRKVYVDELISEDYTSEKAISGQKFCQKTEMKGVCLGSNINCNYYRAWKEGCKTNINCCWDEENKICNQGVCTNG